MKKEGRKELKTLGAATLSFKGKPEQGRICRFVSQHTKEESAVKHDKKTITPAYAARLSSRASRFC
jgi:hypothetical protein